MIPRDVIQEVESGPKGVARIAVSRIGGTMAEPTLCIVSNALGAAGITQIIAHAVQTAPSEEDRLAWKALGLQITSAILGAIGHVMSLED